MFKNIIDFLLNSLLFFLLYMCWLLFSFFVSFLVMDKLERKFNSYFDSYLTILISLILIAMSFFAITMAIFYSCLPFKLYHVQDTLISKEMIWIEYTKELRIKKGIHPEFLVKIDLSLKSEELQTNIYKVATEELINQSSLNETQKKAFKEVVEKESMDYYKVQNLIKEIENNNKEKELKKIFDLN